MLDLLEQDANVDTVFMELSATFLAQRDERNPRFTQEQLLDALGDFRRRSRKPFLCILLPGFREVKAVELRKELVEREVATFPSFERGARALKKLVDYYSRSDS
jgi:hypothetical protein